MHYAHAYLVCEFLYLYHLLPRPPSCLSVSGGADELIYVLFGLFDKILELLKVVVDVVVVVEVCNH